MTEDDRAIIQALRIALDAIADRLDRMERLLQPKSPIGFVWGQASKMQDGASNIVPKKP